MLGDCLPTANVWIFIVMELIINIKHLNYESRKGTIQNYFANPKNHVESISFRQIAFEKFVRSKKQFQILVLIQRSINNMKIENSLQPKNLSKIQKISSNREEHFVTWHLRQ